MEMYPALKARMGDTDYYIVRMRLDEIHKNVHLIGAPYEYKALSQALQRKLDEGRVKDEITSFLERPDRFFSSIVVASIGGNPEFHPVRITAEKDESASLFKAGGIDESFGVLVFKAGVKFYALDGQHRLAAIQSFIGERKQPDISGDHISVVLIASQSDENKPLPPKEMRKRRRLFSWLNRYAKKPGKDTDIIMDEEDAFAILTRRLINDSKHFQPRSGNSIPILMSGKSVPVGTGYFTGLQTLYGINRTLLTSDARLRDDTRDPRWNTPRSFMASRPTEEELEGWYNELSGYWDGLFQVIPNLTDDPVKMRNDSGTKSDHIFFRPIGQEYVMAPVARLLMDESPKKDVQKALAPMAKIPLNLREYPWKGLLARPLPPTEKRPNSWEICNEGRLKRSKLACEFAKHILQISCELDADGLFNMWEELYWSSEKENINNTWKKKICPLLHL